MAALMTADTWLGASGCARGSQTCRGTIPALLANPTISRANATDAVPESAGTRAIAVKPVPPPAAARTANPSKSITKLKWVITEYHRAAERTGARWAWSARSSTVEATAISSQHSRNETASAAAGTSCSASRNKAIADQEVREAAGPCT